MGKGEKTILIDVFLFNSCILYFMFFAVSRLNLIGSEGGIYYTTARPARPLTPEKVLLHLYYTVLLNYFTLLTLNSPFPHIINPTPSSNRVF